MSWGWVTDPVFTMAMTEDLSDFFDTDDHAVTAIYTPKGYPHPSSKSRSVDGIFDKTFYESNEVSSSVPIFTCSTADVSDVSRGAKIKIESVEYTIVEHEPDGTGITALQLEKV